MSQSPASETTPDRVDRLQRRRTRITFVQFALFAAWQGNFLALHAPPERTVEGVKLSAYVVWCVVLMLFMATGGAWLQPREVRRILNDESTLEHRRRSTSLGFWVALTAALACYGANMIWPLTAFDVSHAVLSSGLGMALLRFGFLERRAQADA